MCLQLTAESGVLNSLILQIIISLTFSMAGSQKKNIQLPYGKTFVHSLFCAVWRILAMFIHSDRVELFCCFVWNYQRAGNIYLLEMALNLLLCGFRLYMFYWTRYHTDLEQMLKKNHQNIRQNGHWKLETSLKVGLQREGAHNRRSETVMN